MKESAWGGEATTAAPMGEEMGGEWAARRKLIEQCSTWEAHVHLMFFNRPCVAGTVLQTAFLSIDKNTI